MLVKIFYFQITSAPAELKFVYVTKYTRNVMCLAVCASGSGVIIIQFMFRIY